MINIKAMKTEVKEGNEKSAVTEIQLKIGTWKYSEYDP